jgi:ABC-type bacteriocin/lantibiotic exporter with double-glycine peptidase domain
MPDRRLSRVFFWLCLCGTLVGASPPGVWLDVPFVKQEKDGCGAASIAMVMQYWLKQEGRAPELAADGRYIQRALYSRPAHGIYASDLQGYLERQGFQTFAFSGRWEDLRQHLEKGRPLIVALKPGAAQPLHYVVVAGLDWERGLVMVNDPAGRKLLKEDRVKFETEWKSADSWTLLALPRQESR